LAVVDSVAVRAFGGGDAIGPSPAHRRNAATVRKPVLDENGVPLVTRTAPANASEHGQNQLAVTDLPYGLGNRCGPRCHTDVGFADRGYDGEAIRDALHAQGIESVIARRREDHGSSLGRR